MIRIWLLYTLLLLLTQVLSLSYVKILSYDKFVEMVTARARDGKSPGRLVSWRLDSESLHAVEHLQQEISSGSWSMSGCSDEQLELQCKAPRTKPHPNLPLTAAERNALLQRPSPEVVRANIQSATRGELSEVCELVERVIDNVHNLDALRDDELAVMASNFHNATTGWVLSSQDLEIDFQEWPTDMLLPEDEARALMASFLHVLTNAEYRDRGEQEIFDWYEREVKPEEVCVTCHADVMEVVERFLYDVAELNKEVLLSESAWIERYEWHVAKLRASFYARARGIPGDPIDGSIASIEEIVSAAEELVDQKVRIN